MSIEERLRRYAAKLQAITYSRRVLFRSASLLYKDGWTQPAADCMLRLSFLQRWPRRFISSRQLDFRSNRLIHIPASTPQYYSTQMPMQSFSTLKSYGNFDLVKRFRLELANAEISKWRSRITGLTLVHVDYEGFHSSNCCINTILTAVCSSDRRWLFCCGYRE